MVYSQKQDTGWAWIALLGGFVAYFIADGWSFSFSVLYPVLLQYFEESSSKTSLIGALLYGLPQLLSPFICALITVYGCRSMGIIGGVIVGVSFIFSAAFPSVEFLVVMTGIVGTVGLSFTYLTALIAVTMYFEKRRALATSIAVTGSALGSFFIPPLFDVLITYYGWRGSLLLFGCIAFHIVPASGLFRPLKLDQVIDVNAANERTDLMQHSNEQARVSKSKSLTSLHEDVSSSKTSDDHTHTTAGASASLPNVTFQIGSHEIDMSPLAKPEPVKLSWRVKLKSELGLAMSSMVNKAFTHNWKFITFAAANFILYLWVGVPFLFIVAQAELLELPYASFLVSAIGIGRFFGQLAFGYIGDIKQFNCIVVYGVATCITGIAVLLEPLCTSFVALVVFAFVFGFFVSVTYVLGMMCVIHLVGLEHSNGAFGLFQLPQGIATILGTPLAGKLVWLL